MHIISDTKTKKLNLALNALRSPSWAASANTKPLENNEEDNIKKAKIINIILLVKFSFIINS